MSVKDVSPKEDCTQILLFFVVVILLILIFFFFNDTATTEIYTLSLHDALPIWPRRAVPRPAHRANRPPSRARTRSPPRDRKSTRLNSSHSQISYAVFCLKKKKDSRTNGMNRVTSRIMIDVLFAISVTTSYSAQR